ncbi:N-acylneuraminate cytidylyltransferase [Pontibacter ummariensis]|uniref:N-acylneuraminate cytidylyltransferase n=1 Tax=Pontibacter ummariensis TaxID=1610492 RepID=A0A239EJQ8_9BACT|nr:acylneuraminate cytidylyltransferase family protein [Pontibacter ummariensis]PRY13298.1 N-acylneuraminate cytidylyltransferase [Pontibacter ummariensis]SNS44895.1 N-acylneuraminate cytidylyltransferase [Pontibacter ummariensis]
MSFLFLIPARGGSKGLPGKNIKPIQGKPLIQFTIDAAREISDPKNICVSTDDAGIAAVVQEYGIEVPFIRPKEFATDHATTEQVVLHALQFYESKGVLYDYIVLLQPTSPLRTGKHLQEALNLVRPDTEMIVSVKETDANPYYVLFEEDPDGVLQKSKEGNFSRRQDCPKVYELNGAIYIINVDKLKQKGLGRLKKQKYVMNKVASIDIDDGVDFSLVELVISREERG